MQDNEDNRRVKLMAKSAKSKKSTPAKKSGKSQKMGRSDALAKAREVRAKKLAAKKEAVATSNVVGELKKPKKQKNTTITQATKKEMKATTTDEKADTDNFENKPNFDTDIIENPSNRKLPASDEHPLDKSVVGHKSLLKVASNKYSRAGVDPSQVSPEPVETAIANSNTYIDTTLNTKSSQYYYFPRSQNDGIIFTD